MTVRRIVVVGSNAATGLVAAALARSIDREQLQITVVGDTAANNNGLLYASCDALQPVPGDAANASGLNEDLLVSQDAASFTYGIALTGWSRPDASYFHPFAPPGASFGPLSFHHVVRKLRSAGTEVRYANYSLASLAAQAGRFRRPPRDPESVLSTARYGLHVDLSHLGRLMRSDAESAGVTYLDGPIVGVERGSDGAITSVLLESGTHIKAGLYIDCRDGEAQPGGLDGEAEWQSWSHCSPFDRYVAGKVSPDQSIAPYSHSQAYSAGWIHYVPTPASSAATAFFSSQSASDDQTSGLLQQFAGSTIDALTSGDCRFGRQSTFWRGNCVALGPAAVRLDPVGCSNLSLLQLGIDRLLRLLPGSGSGRVEAAEYNRQMAELCDRARDFAFLHYRLNGRRGEPAWDAIRQTEASDALEYTIRLYKSRGHVVLYDEEPLEEASWINLFDEHGVRPRSYNRIADGFDSRDLVGHLERMRKAMIDEIGKMPLHTDYLASIRAATRADI